MKNSIDPILELLEFNEQETEIFLSSIQFIKAQQSDDSINASIEILKLLKEYSNNEISKNQI